MTNTEKHSPLGTGNLYLIGYRGAGKTTLAPLIAKRLGREWVDLDYLIESLEGISVSDIFKSQGESAFRKMESAVLADIASHHSLVVSTGGGIVLDPANRQLLQSTGIVIWLKASPQTLVHRIEQDPTLRPALTSLPLIDEITTLLKQRQKHYESTAHLVLDTEHHTLDELAEKVISYLTTDNAIHRA
ncbi:MAG: shikimate kinase [Planctomycetia bacterium]|nr:shikimate kinase [Planctomycetia bacterium]